MSIFIHYLLSFIVLNFHIYGYDYNTCINLYDIIKLFQFTTITIGAIKNGAI